MPVDQTRGPVGDPLLDARSAAAATPAGGVNAAAKERPGGKPGKRKKDELWSRIATLASKEKLSYLEATERCVKNYWKDHGLDKRP